MANAGTVKVKLLAQVANGAPIHIGDLELDVYTQACTHPENGSHAATKVNIGGIDREMLLTMFTQELQTVRA